MLNVTGLTTAKTLYNFAQARDATNLSFKFAANAGLLRERSLFFVFVDPR